MQIPFGAEADGLGADDIEELEEDEDEYFRLGEQDEEFKDYGSLSLKLDHQNRRALQQLPYLHASAA